MSAVIDLSLCVPGRSMLAPLVCADPNIFVKYAPDPETTIACFLLNTPAQIANVLTTPLKAQNIGLAEEVLRGEYPDCDVGIQSTLFDVRKGIRGR